MKLSELKQSKSEVILFKANFEKAFDSVCWSFLDEVMNQMNFPLVWLKWIYSCLSWARTSILVNGSPTREFDVTCGLRQGDPLFPFLFIIVMEALSITMDSAKALGIYNDIKLPHDGPHVSHLFFADDALFLGSHSRRNIKT